jgi:hypothetical protein
MLPSISTAAPAMYDASGWQKGGKEGDVFRRAITAEGCQAAEHFCKRDCHI